MKLLEKLKNRLSKENISEEDSVLLDKIIVDFFPKNGEWSSQCFNRPKCLCKENLPCHLNDNTWISKLLQKELQQKGIVVDISIIKKYINSSKLFAVLKHDYELSIVNWQICHMQNGGENWIMPKGYGGYDLLFGSNLDKMFRQGVLETLQSIGIDADVIEEGLEKFADLWRDYYMEKAFNNSYEPKGFGRDQIVPADESFKQNWLRLRKYEYYYEHKYSVDKYGKEMIDVKLTTIELCDLIELVDEQSAKRQIIVKQWKDNPKKHNSLFDM